jgi:putative ABC transport system permease protein
LTTTLEHAIRDGSADFDPRTIVTGAELRESLRSGFLDQSAFSGIAGALILLLSALGIHGVVGLMVSTRTREIAVRVTLGASRPRVMGMVLSDVVKLVAPGVAIGLLIAGGLTRLDGGLVGVPISAFEPLAYVVGASLAILIAVVASLFPARRAASVDPMVALRST